MLQKLERLEGHRRLERLALELRTIEFPGFNMASWSTCAMCVAGQIEEFKAAGLNYRHESPNYKNNGYCVAAASFFDIPHETARSLFDTKEVLDLSQHEVADRIDKVLDDLALEVA